MALSQSPHRANAIPASHGEAGVRLEFCGRTVDPRSSSPTLCSRPHQPAVNSLTRQHMDERCTRA